MIECNLFIFYRLLSCLADAVVSKEFVGQQRNVYHVLTYVPLACKLTIRFYRLSALTIFNIFE